ncbi:MAG TPA: SRPBCC domain-containing protein [Candidatus Eisenbacteria bacterium]|nr:SRPBCC domain-containing protein [Candidatus Eisenbacteria bacterium]
MSETIGTPEEFSAPGPEAPPPEEPAQGAAEPAAPAEAESTPAPPPPSEPSQPTAPPQPAVPTPRQPQRPPDAARCHRGLRPPVLEVWRYLSRPELLARWLGNVDLELVVGGDFSLHAWNGDVVRGRVLLADPPSTLALVWKPQGTGAESRVTIQLKGDGPGSRISVRHEGLASEPERRQARRLWREILTALRSAIHDNADAHEWGASLPISVRAPLSRSSRDLWPLLSTAQGLGKWIGHVDRFDGAPEGLFRFTSRVQGRDVAEEGVIEQMTDQNRVILGWEWVGEAWGGRTKVEMTLEPDPSGAAILLLHSGFDKIAPAQAAIARRHYAATWPRLVANLRRLVAPVHA